MVRLAESVANWLGRVELVARGADEDRRAALAALENGDPLEARARALALLSKVPGSPIGLALLAEAAEQAWLYDDAVDALGELCASAPWRGELWVRLAHMLQRVGAPAHEVRAVCQNALEPEMDAEARRSALLMLTDLDLQAGDAWRASRWLDALRMSFASPEVALRRVELGLAFGDRDLVTSALGDLGEADALDGRATLAQGRAEWLLGLPGALDMLMRALILEAPGADQALASYLASTRDAVEVARSREVLAAEGKDGEPGFALALALAEGRTDDAQRALEAIARAGDRTAGWSLYEIALERSDLDALETAVGALGDDAPTEARDLLSANLALEEGREAEALGLMDRVGIAGTAVGAVAAELRVRVYRKWLEHGGDERFRSILSELRRAAATLDKLDQTAACEGLAIESERPLRVAVVGEFNAGKSTFINALIGADVAPTGILPTTASLHWLSWAPDPFARIVVVDREDRIVTHEALKGALREILASDARVREVHICAPIERLKRIEVLDTPGFNAPNADHVGTARRALQEAHVALWLLDAAQPLKDSERQVLSTIASVGTPIQVLVNKCDRLPEAEVPQVVSHVMEGLQEVGLETMHPALGFSARLALAGRLGDPEAARRSGWDGVENLLATCIVNRSEALRAAAIRRKARDVAGVLDDLVRARSMAATHPSADERGGDQAARLDALGRRACERIVEELHLAVEAVGDDLRPLGLAGVGLEDAHAQAYAEARVVARLVEPLTALLAREADIDEAGASLVGSSVSWVVRGACASVSDLDGLREILHWRLVRACAVAAKERLLMEGTAKGRLRGPEGARWARLSALRCALEQGLPSAPGSGTVQE